MPTTSLLVTPDVILRLCPQMTLPHALLLEGFNRFFPQFEITTKLRIAAFLAQAAHETGGFRTLKEYGGTAYFTKHYEGRKDLGNVVAGDGARYHGRGIFQLTGRANYQRLGKKIGLPLEEKPELAASPTISAQVACVFWRGGNPQGKDLNILADAGEFKAITKVINGGFNGLEDREKYYKSALKLLGD